MNNQRSGQVQVIDSRENNRFEIRVDGELAGFAEYRRYPGRVLFTHTETEPAYQDQGIAAQLARYALESVRAEGLQVTPRCPYIASYISDHPDYIGLVDDEHRSKFSAQQEK